MHMDAYQFYVIVVVSDSSLLTETVDLATSLYDYACGRIPNNLDLMMGLFNCYVREYAYVKQQQVDGFCRPPLSLVWVFIFSLGICDSYA